MSEFIDNFTGEYRFLSNFYQGRPIVVHGVAFATVEHGFQAYKMTTAADFYRIVACPTPGGAKRLARKLPMSPDWNERRITVMRMFLREKFKDPELAQKLLATGDANLIEGNTWGDTFWGVCRGKGENNLGKLLMELRQEMK